MITKKRIRKDGGFDIDARLLPEDKDFKNTKKLCWLPNKPKLLVKQPF